MTTPRTKAGRDRRWLLFQCPGCWSSGQHLTTTEATIECECGERMTRVDLRAPEAEAATPLPLDVERLIALLHARCEARWDEEAKSGQLTFTKHAAEMHRELAEYLVAAIVAAYQHREEKQG